MTNANVTRALEHVRTLFDSGAAGSQTDRHLLEQLATGHREAAEAAFSILVERHGAMVLRVCRAVMGDSHDVHDAFQATFLVLVRKAGSLWISDSIGPWLHGVALRVSRKARSAEARRKTHERRYSEAATHARYTMPNPDVAPIVHEEVGRLPKKYRSPIVLCYFEGMTHEAAAGALGWPVGTVRGRMARGRDILRKRLARRGFGPAAGTIAALLAAEEACAVPAEVSSVRALCSLVTERSGGVAPPNVATLSRSCLQSMALARLARRSAALLLATTLLGLVAIAQTKLPKRESTTRPVPVPPAASREVAPQPSPAQPDMWPANTRVQGQVVDHRGKPVAGAEVLLLSYETLSVAASNPSANRPFRLTPSTSPPAPSTATMKTDDAGRFSLIRPTTSANRIAVVCQNMFLWEVTRKEIPEGKALVIALPKPAPLTIRSEIPEKPATQEFWIVGRLPYQHEWRTDWISLHVQVPNPGEQVLGSLPPFSYVIERMNSSRLGRRANALTPCERRLVQSEAGKDTLITYDRVVGRRIEGHVKGVEGFRCRSALVTIAYWGPEERNPNDQKVHRQETHFDVVSVGDDGSFITPRLPANRYSLRFDGVLASTEEAAHRSSDFNGSATVDVTDAGRIAPVEIIAERIEVKGDETGNGNAKAPRLEVRAVDENGASIQDFEIQLYNGPVSTAPVAESHGVAVYTETTLKDWARGQLIVTAPGFASEIREQGEIKEPTRLDVVLKRGTEVRLHVRDQRGKPISPAVMPLPQVYLPWQRRDALLALATQEPDARALQVEQMNILNVRPDGAGDFVFHLRTDQSEPLYFAFSQPGKLSFYETTVAASDLMSGRWDIVLPEPTTAEVTLKVPTSPDGEPLFESAHYTLNPASLGRAGQVPVFTSGGILGPTWKTAITDLAPGAYDLWVGTVPRERQTQVGIPNAHPGVYRDVKRIDVKAGSHLSVVIDPPPFNSDAWHGPHKAIVTVKAAAERDLIGENYNVWYHLAHYGRLPVAHGKLAKDGRITLENIAASGPGEVEGSYAVDVGGDHAGEFRVKEERTLQEFSIGMPVRAGDLAPDGKAIDLATSKPVGVSHFRGRYVFLEFWATWCGPCQEPMAKLAEMARRRQQAGKNDIAFVAVSVDEDRETVLRHLKIVGPTGIHHLWSPRSGAEWTARAARDFSVYAVPTAFLIDPEGRILWRGHPSSIDLEQKVISLLNEPRDAAR